MAKSTPAKEKKTAGSQKKQKSVSESMHTGHNGVDETELAEREEALARKEAAFEANQKILSEQLREVGLLKTKLDLHTKQLEPEPLVPGAPADWDPDSTDYSKLVRKKTEYRSRRAAKLRIGRVPRMITVVQGGQRSEQMKQPPPFAFEAHRLVLSRREEVLEFDLMIANDRWLATQVYKVNSTMKETLRLATEAGSSAAGKKNPALTPDTTIANAAGLFLKAFDDPDFPVDEAHRLTDHKDRLKFTREWYATEKRVVFPNLPE